MFYLVLTTVIREHSKSTFAQNSPVLTPPSALFTLVCFRAPPPPPSRYVSFGQTFLLPLNFYTCEIQRKEINNGYQYRWLNSTCLLRSHSGICIKWKPLVHDKSVCFMEISYLQRVHLKPEVFKSNHQIRYLP